jgi:cullin-associated NEDD8-dissociated protein 1
LIETVDLGPFKHKVDNGLPMRKAAFQLLETLYDQLQADIDINRAVEQVVHTGLGDGAEECIVLNLNILNKLSQRSGVVVISFMDPIV